MRRTHQPSHYAMLGVARNFTAAQLKRQHRLLSLRFHPDAAERNGVDPEQAADGSPLPDWGGRQGLGQICVAVDTDDGRTGFGVCGGGAPGITIIETVIHAPPTFRWYARHTFTLHSLPLR